MVAIPSMNDTHLEEILIINRLDTAARSYDTKTVGVILKELLEHTVIHFSDEEEMMQETAFPAYLTHKAEHDRHLQELNALIEYFEKNQDPKAIFVYIEGSLSPWLKHHINTMDTVTAMFLQEKHAVSARK